MDGGGCEKEEQWTRVIQQAGGEEGGAPSGRRRERSGRINGWRERWIFGKSEGL